jgi:phage regulator Rha-like protein
MSKNFTKTLEAENAFSEACYIAYKTYEETCAKARKEYYDYITSFSEAEKEKAEAYYKADKELEKVCIAYEEACRVPKAYSEALKAHLAACNKADKDYIEACEKAAK